MLYDTLSGGLLVGYVDDRLSDGSCRWLGLCLSGCHKMAKEGVVFDRFALPGIERTLDS